MNSMSDPPDRPAESFRLYWLADYESGHPKVDRQHQRLFGAINALMDAENAAPSRKIELLDELVMQVMEHFRDEEELLARCGYAELALHAASHAHLVERLLALRHEMIAQATAYSELLEFLAREVVEEHLLLDDRRYFDALMQAFSAER